LDRKDFNTKKRKFLNSNAIFFKIGSEQKKYTSFAATNNEINEELNAISSLNTLPINWDLLLTGMRIGETRVLYLPNCFYNRDEITKLIKTDLAIKEEQLGDLVIEANLLSIDGLSTIN
jgi:hypothetical protein